MKLRTKFALVLAALLVLLSAVNVGALVFFQNQTVEQTEVTVQETANRTADQVDTTVATRLDTVTLLANKYPTPTNLTESPSFLRSLVQNRRFWFVEVADVNGTVVAIDGELTDRGKTEQLGKNISDNRYFQVARTGQPAVSKPQNISGRNHSSVFFAAPIWGPDAEVTGVLVAGMEVTVTSVFTMVRPLETGTQAVRVTDASGLALYDTGRSFEKSINGSATVEDFGWSVTVTKDRSRLDARQRLLAILQGLSLLVVFGSVVGFGFWEYRSNLVQTEKLLAGFQRIRGGNYDERLSLASANEWRQISDGFNDLAKGLAEREAALREREQRLSVLNRVIRHNLRNEMTIILNYAELIRETTAEETAETAAGTIATTGRKLADLSQKARQIENALETAEEGFPDQDVVDLVEHSLSNLDEEYPDVDVDLRAPDEQSVAAIPALSKAIENVLENAFEHNDSDDPYVAVAIDTVVRDGVPRVTVSVVDNGPGIPDQEKSVLVQGRETALEHGSGLGLWLVYWVVDKSDGTLRFDENDPRGSIVTIELHAASPGDVTPSAPIEDGEGAADEDSGEGAADEGAGEDASVSPAEDD